MKNVAVTPIAFVRMLLMAYAKYGVDPAGALARAQITPAQVGKAGNHRHVVATAGAGRRGHARAGRRGPGLVLAPPALGQLCDAAARVAHLAQPGCGAQALAAPPQPADRRHLLQLLVAADVATVSLMERRLDAAMREFCLVTLLRNIHGISCWLVDSAVPLEGVAFPFDAPAHANVYPLLFPGPVHFGARHAALSFDSRYLALPLRRDDRALRALLPQALSLVVRPYRRDRLLVQRVRMLLKEQPAAATAEALAHALAMSPRTLHRQLQDEGASLQALKDEVRQEQAMHLLRRTARPVKQVAQAVGFRSEKSFARAFRDWTGESPAEYRRKGVGV
jgi:AraC-like DNA-binding protein